MGVVCKTAESSVSSYSGAEVRLCTPEPVLLDDSMEGRQMSVSKAVFGSVFISLWAKSGGKWGRREAEVLPSNDSDAWLLWLTVDYRTLWA